MYRIKEAAMKAGVSVDAVRFYEKKGLLTNPRRDSNNYRIYTEEMTDILRFISMGKKAGFTLKEINELINVIQSPSGSSDRLESLAEKKIADLDRKISELTSFRDTISELLSACTSDSISISACIKKE